MSRFDPSYEMENVKRMAPVVVIGGICVLGLILFISYLMFRVDVPERQMAIFINKTGLDVENGDEFAPTPDHKGVQLEIKTEGRYSINPYAQEARVYPMVEVPENKLGVRVRLYGDDLPYGHFVATTDKQKGVVKEILNPGRYAINAMVKGKESDRPYKDYVEIVELYDPVTIPAGYRGIVTNLAGPMPEKPNDVLAPKGFRGVQEETLEPGTYYLNPYMYTVYALDCRSHRFNLAEGKDMGFPSKDGFWVFLDGIIEFRVQPDKAAWFYVLYNEDRNGTRIDEEIINKIILPNARSFCRTKGSNSSGREFIGGETRTNFQNAFEASMIQACGAQGIDIMQALITRIIPPEAIADPVRKREVAHQQEQQYKQETLQQQQEALLAVEKALVEQKKQLVAAEQENAKVTTAADQQQQVDVTLANQRMEVAQRNLDAAKDQAAAITSAKKAEAAVITFENEAAAAGWKKSIEALGGDGEELARYVLYQKLAPAYRSMQVNTADSPLMRIFENFRNSPPKLPAPTTAGK